MKRIHILLAWILLLLGTRSLPAERLKFTVDPAHTSITFQARHMMVTRVTGTFEKVRGWIEIDPGDPTTARAEGEVEVASINTRNAKRDRHLKSDDFFAADRYPVMKMVLKKVYRKGESWWADADLTIRDITRRVSFPFILSGPVKDPWGNLRIGVEGTFTVDRFAFGLKWNKTLETGGLVVGRDIKVTLQIEAIHSPEK